jgi:hypothetical protein
MNIDKHTLHKVLCGQILIKEIEDGFRVATQVLYPSNSSVTVTVRGGENFIVSDDGGALHEISGTGRIDSPSDRRIRAIIKNFGLKVQDGAIISPQVPIDHVPAAILLVANASKAVTEWAYAHIRFKMNRNFKKDLEEVLQRHFHDNLKSNTPVVGESNKEYNFPHVIYLNDARKLLIDPVINDSSSINARVVANMDVRMRHDPKIQQMIVYDDRLDWNASDLRLLRVGTPNVVPFSAAEPQITNLAA